MQRGLQFGRRTYPGCRQPCIQKTLTEIGLPGNMVLRLVCDHVGMDVLTNDEDQPVQTTCGRFVKLQTLRRRPVSCSSLWTEKRFRID